ncbi:MAG TPA: quercetin 2,3-dioxygenase [Rubrobacteraceae bacterium]|nr:quercetin 2,3-dioxygenase [Rubrobacteraceae bacterium]
MNYEGGAAHRAFGREEGAGNARWWGGGLATIKATGRETAGLYSIIEVLEPQGARAPLHLHRKEDEAFYVIEGQVTFRIGEQTIKGHPGTFVFGPKDVPHTYTVDSGPARLLFLLSPAGFEGFVETISEPARARTLPPSKTEDPSDERDKTDEARSESFAVLEARYGCEIVGTPPEHRPGGEQVKEESMTQDDDARAYGLDEGEGEARWWLGVSLATIKATGKETDGRYTLVEVLEPEGEEAPLHVHHNEDEAFWVLEGELTFQVGEETIKASPGSFLFGPKDVPHRYTVESGPARLLFILSPAGFEEFIYATSEPAKERTLPPPPEGPPSEAEMEQLEAVARQHGAELLV